MRLITILSSMKPCPISLPNRLVSLLIVMFSVDFKRALQLDSLDTSHPIEVPVGHPEEVDEIFDAISYSKGTPALYSTRKNKWDF